MYLEVIPGHITDQYSDRTLLLKWLLALIVSFHLHESRDTYPDRKCCRPLQYAFRRVFLASSGLGGQDRCHFVHGRCRKQDKTVGRVAVFLRGYMAVPLLADTLEGGRAHQEPWMRVSRSRCLAALQRSAQRLFAAKPEGRRRV